MKPLFTLRPWQLTDVDSLLENANNLNVARFMSNQFPFPYTQEHALKFIEYVSNESPIHIFAIEVAGKGVGGIGIHPQTDILCKNAELGYWLGEKYWGQGIVTAAIEKMIPLAFETYDINRIFARPFGNNPASAKVLEKAGFVLEARLSNTIYKFGEYLDELIYAYRKQE